MVAMNQRRQQLQMGARLHPLMLQMVQQMLMKAQTKKKKMQNS
jgi:hypothetical protein